MSFLPPHPPAQPPATAGVRGNAVTLTNPCHSGVPASTFNGRGRLPAEVLVFVLRCAPSHDAHRDLSDTLHRHPTVVPVLGGHTHASVTCMAVPCFPRCCQPEPAAFFASGDFEPRGSTRSIVERNRVQICQYRSANLREPSRRVVRPCRAYRLASVQIPDLDRLPRRGNDRDQRGNRTKLARSPVETVGGTFLDVAVRLRPVAVQSGGKAPG